MSQHNLLQTNPNPDNVKNNIIIIILYALSLTAALGFNDLILTIFNNFKITKSIIAKIIYVAIVFIVTIGLAYYFNSSIKS
jgi:hypothetical protein